MRVVCDRAALLEAVNLVSGVVASRTPRPQLTCVRLDATSEDGVGTLVLSGTDAETSMRLAVDRVDVERAGEALVPADKLRQIIQAEDHESTLTLEADGDSCQVLGTDARFRVLGYPASDFPAIGDFKSAVKGSAESAPARAVFTHNAGDLSELIARTIFATARENSRYAINGVLLHKDGKKVEMVATDGKRLALARSALAAPGAGDGPVKCIVPTKALQHLQKLLGDDEEPVRLAVGENRITFAIGASEDGEDPRALLSSTLVEGAFPPYQDVIPKDQDKSITFDRDLLFSAVKRAALLTNEESRGVRLEFDSAGKKLRLSSRAPEMGEANVEIELKEYKGDGVEIGFNPGFITEALKVINQPEIVMELKDSMKPGLIRSGPDFTYVVMPVNLQ